MPAPEHGTIIFNNKQDKRNRELTNEIASPKEFIADANSRDFAHGQEQALNSINANLSPIIKINKFDFTDSKRRRNLFMNTTTGELTRKLWIL